MAELAKTREKIAIYKTKHSNSKRSMLLSDHFFPKLKIIKIQLRITYLQKSFRKLFASNFENKIKTDNQYRHDEFWDEFYPSL